MQSNTPLQSTELKIYRDDQIIDSCIINGSGGETSVHQISTLIDSDRLLICYCDTVFSLTISDLELKWKTQADQAICFQIFMQQADYIVHGELQVTKIDKDGNKKWKFGYAYIFVSPDNADEFKVESDGILLTDFGKTKYKIDFNWKLLWDTNEWIAKTVYNT